MAKKNPHRGSSFDDFLKEEGIHAETQTVAVRRVLAWQLAEIMKEQGVSKSQMAKRMQTSRSQLDRILDPDYRPIQLDAIVKAARVLGREVKFELV